MYSYIDLRYALPPLINLSFLLVASPGESWDRDYDFISKILQYPVLLIPLFVVVILILFLLFTSIKFPFIVEPVRLQTGHFSAPVAIMLLAAIIFSPPLFWFLYLLLIIIAPWRGNLFNLFMRMFHWFHHTLRSIPPLIVVCITQHRQTAELSSAAEVVDIEDHAIQDNVNPDQLTNLSGNIGQITERSA